MLTLSTATKIFAYLPPADMRKGFRGLSAIIREEFQADPTDGSLFLFINRRRDRMKLLHFADGGFWLYYRLLEAGTFEPLKATSASTCQLQLDATELSMLLAGISLAQAGKRRKRFVA
jgi:transposase